MLNLATTTTNTPISTGQFGRKRFTIDHERAYETPTTCKTTSTSPAINLHLASSRAQKGIYALASNLRIDIASRSAQSSSLSPSSPSSSNLSSSSRNHLQAPMEPASKTKAFEPKYLSPIYRARADLESKRRSTVLYKSRSERNLLSDMNPKKNESNDVARVTKRRTGSSRQTNDDGAKPNHWPSKLALNDADDDLKLDEIDYTHDDYKQLVLHYKNLCKSYKRQLVDSHKTIRELHSTIEQLENRNYIQR